MDPTKRYIGLGVALLLITGAIVAVEKPWDDSVSRVPSEAGVPREYLRYEAAPDFGGATGWVNSEPLDLVELRGQVVLVDFWTYSCINCIRTLPHVVAWYDRYDQDGLVVVGVHTPEFRFERERANVREAAERYDVRYPVAQHNEYDVWDAYGVHAWPTKVLLDHWGRVRYTHVGEGAYAETEQVMRDLLTESGHPPSKDASEDGVVRALGTNITPELFAATRGGTRASAIGNEAGFRDGDEVAYALPAELARDRIYLDGRWEGAYDHVTALEAGRVVVPFRAATANFVADGPTGACVQVLLDGAPIGPDRAAVDVEPRDGVACVVLDGPRSYDFFYDVTAPHTLELVVPEGFELWTFAFSSKGKVTP